MDTKHTKGPWSIDKVRPGMDLVNIVQGNSSRTASNVIAFDVLDHNARLIAAAPDLLEALRDALKLEAGLIDGTEAQSAVRQRALAAIAKAEGE